MMGGRQVCRKFCGRGRRWAGRRRARRVRRSVGLGTTISTPLSSRPPASGATAHPRAHHAAGNVQGHLQAAALVRVEGGGAVQQLEQRAPWHKLGHDAKVWRLGDGAQLQVGEAEGRVGRPVSGLSRQRHGLRRRPHIRCCCCCCASRS